MRHGKKIKKLGRSASHRKAMLANMATSLLIHKRIKTTEAKAKEARKLVERLITYGKKGTIHARRLAFAILRHNDIVKILFDEVAPVFSDRSGGYTRIYKLGRRPNDAAKVVLLELVDFIGTEKSSKKEKKTVDKLPKEQKKSEKEVEEKKTTKEVEIKNDTDNINEEKNEKSDDMGEKVVEKKED